MKKLFGTISALLAAAVLFAGCSGGETAESVLKEGQSDIQYIKDKGTFIIGITDYAPMDFKDGDNWTGFDAELSLAFAEELGVTPQFVEIDWDKRTGLLQSGAIDCIWNGMTLTEELQQEIDCSQPYASSGQVIVMQKEKLDKYETVEQCQHLLFTAEGGSSGEAVIKELKYRYTPYETMKETLQSVCDNKADAAVIDIIMAGYYSAGENEFSQLGYKFLLNDEKIGVGLRKGSDLTDKVNEFLSEMTSSGKMNEIAEKYGIADAVLD